MLGGDWRKLAKVVGIGLAVLSGVLLVYFAGFWMGSGAGYFDAQADGYAAQYPSDTDQRVERCFREAQPPRDTQNCVSEAVQASHENERTEQDLSAQRQSANWAWWIFVATLAQMPLTVAGLIFLLRTIWQGQEALHHARYETRPYVFIEKIDIEEKAEDTYYRVIIWYKNFGNTPGRNLKASTHCYVADDLVDLEPINVTSIIDAGVVAPGGCRRTFDSFYFTKQVREDFEHYQRFVVLRIIYWYVDDYGNSLGESVDYYMNPEGLKNNTFYILSDQTREDIRIAREQRSLFDEGWDEEPPTIRPARTRRRRKPKQEDEPKPPLRARRQAGRRAPRPAARPVAKAAAAAKPAPKARAPRKPKPKPEPPAEA